MIRAALIAGLLAAPLPALAEADGPACGVLAQVSTASFLRLAQALSEGVEAEIDRHSARLADLTQTYATLDCETEALAETLDCVLTRAGGEGNARAVARRCLAEAGLIAE